MSCEEYKTLVDSCGKYECKQYNWFDYLSSWCEYAWVYSYHRYYNTDKYKEWEFANELLKKFRANQKLAQRLQPQKCCPERNGDSSQH
jgi:hypothetical protein